ncbi:Molybdenum cofactor synthesis protein 1 [Tyrophagus putrescentiae]|nr:Molybdenum cofactor synthesis protein 1 [Tyrophagus putrescentiae]
MLTRGKTLGRTLLRLQLLPSVRFFSSSSSSSSGSSAVPEKRQDLSDTFGRKHDYLRISLTEKCSLRCLYCMPEEGVQLTPSEKLLTTEEILRLARLFVHRFGVKKIRLTGGEPLIRPDILDIVRQLNGLKAHGLQKIALTTNGIVFARQAAALHSAGLDSVNISLDTLRPERFEAITRRRGLTAVLKAIEAALNEGFDSVKINVVPLRGVNDDEAEDFVQLTRSAGLEGNRWEAAKMVSFSELLRRVRSRFPGLQQLPPASVHETARLYRVDGHAGTVGFIASMSNAFCGGCNRVRLTADGHLKVCLFGKEEVSLKEALRRGDDDELISQIIVDAVLQKKKAHAGAVNIAKDSNRPMILIDKTTHARHFSTDSKHPSSPSPSLSHIDATTGRARMVKVSSKSPTARLHLGPAIIAAIEANALSKGDVLTVAKVAAISATKRTGDLIPSAIRCPSTPSTVEHQSGELLITSLVTVTGKTGVEMEALTAVTVAALTVYDMCKSLDKRMVIREVKLLSKTGGKSGDFSCGDQS